MTTSSLHDCIALGEIELGLGQENEALDEIQRLPYLLRILASTRPLAEIRPFPSSNKAGGDEDLNKLVESLEDVAATHSVAGGIDVVANHLVPSVTKTLSRLPSLTKGSKAWDTEELAVVAKDPLSKKRKRAPERKIVGDETKIGASSDDDDLVEDTNDRGPLMKRRDSMKMAAEDSQEFTVIKTVSELASLVVTSLDPPNQHSDAGDDDEPSKETPKVPSETRNSSVTLSLHTDDILCEKQTRSGTTAAIEASDLSSTVVAILHNAPVLRCKHVASALCRASVPQTGELISRMGANCPASIPSLLSGCIEAYTMSMDKTQEDYQDGIANGGKTTNSTYGSSPLIVASKSAVEALASLSHTESCRVKNKLQASGVMLDVQLKLALSGPPSFENHSLTSMVCLLVEHLSFSRALKKVDRQSPGDPTARDRWIDFANVYSNNLQEPTLVQHFLEVPNLYVQSLEWFAKIVADLRVTLVSKGKWCLFWKAYALLLLVPVDGTTPKKESLQSYATMVERLSVSFSKTDETKAKGMDAIVPLISSCGFLLILKSVSIEVEVVVPILQSIFRLLSTTSEASNKIRIACLSEARKKYPRGLLELILQPLKPLPAVEELYATTFFPIWQEGLSNVCEIILSNPTVTKEHREEDSQGLSLTIFSLLRRIRANPPKEPSIIEDTKRALTLLLKEANDPVTLGLVKNEETLSFIVEATKFLMEPERPEVPIILPIDLEKSWSKISSNERAVHSCTIDSDSFVFLLRFLYAFVFLDICRSSPFVFDPRSAPMKEAFALIDRLSSTTMKETFLAEVRPLVKKHCAEFVKLNTNIVPLESYSFYDLDERSLLDALCYSIRAVLDPSGKESSETTIEQLFLHAKARIRDSDVYCAVTNAFLSTPHAPSPTYTYWTLCRDPIVCLKFPLAVWNCKSLRKIALSVLEALIISNNVITFEESKNEDAGVELLAARDTIIVRCLLAIIHGGDSKFAIICSMTTNMIRWLVQTRAGLVALLVKQGLRDRDLDWLVEHVPETMNDSRFLIQIFSERNSLTVSERLTAADAMIRIAIVHGQTNETEAAQMILTAVSQLVEAFYLILGPVGLLPVDVLLNPESSTPITQTSQKSAFRILKSLTRLPGGRTHIRRECSHVLQKFAALCKGELQGTAAGRRKQVLKELYDAAMKVER